MCNDIEPLTFAEKIHVLRKRRGLSLDDIGASLGVSRPQAGRYVRGESELSLDMLMRLEKALGVTPGNLVRAKMDAMREEPENAE
jgi:transcriptional regulator with XRE-family HTH domain